MSGEPTVTVTGSESPSRIVGAVAFTLDGHLGTLICVFTTEVLLFSSTYTTVRLCLPGFTSDRLTVAVPFSSKTTGTFSPSMNAVTFLVAFSGRLIITCESAPVPLTVAVIGSSTTTLVCSVNPL